VKRKDLVKKIEEFGCKLIRHGGNHDWYQNPQTKISAAHPKTSRNQRQPCSSHPEDAKQRGMKLVAQKMKGKPNKAFHPTTTRAVYVVAGERRR
jgi:hypothetical protein